MTTLITRFAVFVLIMALFAISFATLAVNPDRSFQRVNFGATIPCEHGPSPGCTLL